MRSISLPLASKPLVDNSVLINEPRGKEIRLKTPKGRVWHLQARPCLLLTEKVPGKLLQKVIHTHLHNDLRTWTQHPKQGQTKSPGEAVPGMLLQGWFAFGDY